MEIQKSKSRLQTILVMSANKVLLLLLMIIYAAVFFIIFRSHSFIIDVEHKYNHAKTYIYLSDAASEFSVLLRCRSQSVSSTDVFSSSFISPTSANLSLPHLVASERNSSVPLPFPAKSLLQASSAPSTPAAKLISHASSTPSASAPTIAPSNETYMLVLFTTEVLLCVCFFMGRWLFPKR